MNTRLAYRIGGGALMIGVLGSIVVTIVLFVGVQDPFGDIGATRYMQGILGARNVWLGVHLAFAVLILLKLAGLMTVGDTLLEGPARPLARIANTFAICGAALFVVTMVNDGYLHEYMATGWEHATGATRAEWLPIFNSGLKTTLGMEVGSMVALLGLAPLTYGIAMLIGSRFPRWVGWYGVVAGIGAFCTAIFLWMTGNTDTGYGILYPIFSTLLPMIWYVGLSVLLWRRGAGLTWSPAGTGHRGDAVPAPSGATEAPEAVPTSV